MNNLIQFPQSAQLLAELRELLQADLLRKAEQVQRGWAEPKAPRLVKVRSRKNGKRNELQRALRIGSGVEVTPAMVAKKMARRQHLLDLQRREA